MLSGRRLDLLDPSALDVEIEDIAHGLARVARWNGQTSGQHIFSVAQHTLLVEALARRRSSLDRRARLAVLLHRGRGQATRPELVPGRRALELRFSTDWLERHPLTHADLLEEAELLRAAGFELRVPVMTSV